MTLIDLRVKEMFYLFSKILPIYSDKQKKIIERRLKVRLDEVAPAILLEIAKEALDPFNREAAEGYFNFIVQSILYMTGETDTYPDVEIVQSSQESLTFKK
jgi:hypothetical protein